MYTSIWQDLATRANHGDAAALHELWHQLEPHCVHIVDRALRSETSTSALTCQLRHTADQLAADGDDLRPIDRERLVRQVAQSLCETLIGRLRAQMPRGQALLDTVRD